MNQSVAPAPQVIKGLLVLGRGETVPCLPRRTRELLPKRPRDPRHRLQVDADDPIAFARAIGWLKLTVEELRDPNSAVDASDRLVRWLVDRLEVEA